MSDVSPFVSSIFSRVTETLAREVFLGNLRRIHNNLLLTQEQISTGLRLVRPSVDPMGANLALQFEARIAAADRYLRNVNDGMNRLTVTEGALGSMQSIVNRARQLAVQHSQNIMGAETRRLAGVEIAQMLEEALSIANKMYGERYIFGGTLTGDAPFHVVGGAVYYAGNDDEIYADIAEGTRAVVNLTGAQAFGALRAEILGTADLNPTVTLRTKLSDLNGGRGVQRGPISISDGVNPPVIVDLSTADNVQDVIDIINAYGPPGVRAISGATLSPNGVNIDIASATGMVIVTEVGGGTTARDLGLLDHGRVEFIQNPAVGDTITVNGVALVAGVQFAIGATPQETAANFAAAVVALVPGVSASVEPAPENDTVRITGLGGTLVSLRDAEVTPGVNNVIAQRGDLNPALTNVTPIAALLNGGNPTPFDLSGITIVNRTATATFQASLSFAGLGTVQEIINLINNSGTYTTARINDQRTGLDIISHLSGARLDVRENGGVTGSQMGVVIPLANRPVDQLLNGKGIHPVTGADFRITRQDGVVFDVDVSNARTVQDILDLINLNPQNVDPDGPGPLGPVRASLVGDAIRLVDNSGGAGSFRVSELNGSPVAQELGIVRVVSPPANTITSVNLNPAGYRADNIFTALVDLRDALLNNDETGIQRAHKVLERGEEIVLTARATTGARLVHLEMTHNRHEFEQVELKKMLSEIKDVDLAEAATRLRQQEYVLQGALAVAGRIMQMSLLNFI